MQCYGNLNKTDIKHIEITPDMVQKFENIFGEHKKLPPTFPMLFYQRFNVPWQPVSPPILIKQHCHSYKTITVGESYQSQLLLNIKRKGKKYTFYSETLTVYDKKGRESAKCVSDLMTTSLLQKRT